MKKLLLITIAITVMVAVLFLRGDEDTWICKNGQWVKHGNPSAPMPTGLCGKKQIASITDFQECIDAGNPATESYPRQCRVGNQIFTENVGNEIEKSDLIYLNSPRPNQTIKSPLTVRGQARGLWFFEGSFPVILTDWDGLIIGQGIATAQGEWMTEEFVPFTAVVEFEVPKYKNNGSLILQRDNPSGLPENDDALEIPILFEEKENMLSEYGARVIAENNCIKGEESLAPGYYNENSKTWWFDANLNATQEGCNPACVVSEETKTAEINWRCTGLISPKRSVEEIRILFAGKYPKYAETVTISVNQETENHMRGSVSFKTGEPGGIFLAAKIDGKWQIIFDGNGQISCMLSKHGFPSEMLGDCI